MGRKFSVTLVIALVIVLLAAGVYTGYIVATYYRVGDMSLEVEGEATYEALETEKTYSISTFNLGYGAYQQEYSCIADMGYVQDSSGNWVMASGKHLKALSEGDVRNNTTGATKTLMSLSTDFVLTQETDTSSTRSYNINQKKMVQDAFNGYSSDYAINNHTSFIAYPLSDMEGFVNSGILTLSRYGIQSAYRYELAEADDFISKIYDLDRCFSASYINVSNGKQLVLVNIHLSASASGSTVRDQQRKQLYAFISEEYKEGNYVVVGGDFNHDLLTNNPDYPEHTASFPAFSTQYTEKSRKRVTWFNETGGAELPEGFKLTASDNWPSCRNASTEWRYGFNQIYTIDGFLTSANVEVVTHKNVETDTANDKGFAYSDHEPAYMEFKLK